MTNIAALRARATVKIRNCFDSSGIVDALSLLAIQFGDVVDHVDDDALDAFIGRNIKYLTTLAL